MIPLHATHGPGPVTITLYVCLGVLALGVISVGTLELAWWYHHFRE